ncbi:Uncharacterized protein QTN25_004919 [Entamoeba marina]
MLVNTLKRKTCNCGRNTHNNENMTWLYGFDQSTSNYVSISKLNTEIDLLNTVGSQINYNYCLNFIENMGAAFPQYTCPHLMLMISAMARNSGNEEEALLVINLKTIIVNYCVGHPNALPPTIQYTSCDKQIVQSISNESGICPCGKMHIVNGKKYDYAFVLNNKLVGVDLNNSLMHNCQRICDELGLDKGLIVVVYVTIYDSFMDLMNKILYNDYFYHGSSCAEHDNSKVLDLSNLYELNDYQIADRYFSFYQIFEKMVESKEPKKSNIMDILNGLSGSKKYYFLKGDKLYELDKEFIQNQCQIENKDEIQDGTLEENEYIKTITDMYEEKANSLKKTLESINDNNIVLPIGSPELEPNQVNAMSFENNMIEDIEQNKDEPKLIEEDPQHNFLEQKQHEQKMIEIKELNETEQIKEKCESPLLTTQMKQQMLNTKHVVTEKIFATIKDYKQSGDTVEEEKQKEMDSSEKEFILKCTKLINKGKSSEIDEFEKRFKEKPKGHLLKDIEEDIIKTSIIINPVEYTPLETTNAIRVRTKYQTLTMNVNNSTTICDVVGHVNFCIEKSGKEPYNGKLKQPGSKEDLIQKLNSTLVELKLLKTTLAYVI